MGLGTKNRLLRVANLCRDHLRQTHAAEAALVEEYIAEMEGAAEDGDHTAWAQFTDTKRSDAEMLERLDTAFRKWLNGE